MGTVISNYSTLPYGKAKPKAAIRNLPIPARKVDQAKLPVEYTEAVKAIAACTKIDEAKYWSDKSEALAAWAKIYKDDKVAKEARQLKLHAFRRMGQIAEELRPTTAGGRKGERKGGRSKGARSLLVEIGLTEDQAQAARNISLASETEFNNELKNPPGLSTASRKFRGRGATQRGERRSDAWFWLTYTPGAGLSSVRASFRKRSPIEVAAGIKPDEVEKARELVIEITEWLDAFEQALPKARS